MSLSLYGMRGGVACHAKGKAARFVLEGRYSAKVCAICKSLSKMTDYVKLGIPFRNSKSFLVIPGMCRHQEPLALKLNPQEKFSQAFFPNITRFVSFFLHPLCKQTAFVPYFTQTQPTSSVVLLAWFRHS